MRLYIDVQGTLDQSRATGLADSIRSWLEEADIAEETRTAVVWTSGYLRDAVAAAEMFLPGLPVAVAVRTPEMIAELVDLGSRAAVIDDDDTFRQTAASCGCMTYTGERFVEQMSGDLREICISCGGDSPAETTFESSYGPICHDCREAPDGMSKVTAPDLLDMIERQVAELVQLTPMLSFGDVVEINATLATLRFNVEMAGTTGKNITLLIPAKVAS